MMNKVSLPLDEVLEDAPQTRCLLKLFESDAEKVSSYMQTMHGVLDRLMIAQSDVTAAMATLGSMLGSYKEQSFPLDHDNATYGTVVEKFQGTITELSSWMEIISQQLKNCVLYPVEKFLRELNELNGRKDVFHAVSDDLDSAIIKHAKLNRRDSAKKIEDTNEELCASRRQFHLAGLHYYVNMNNLQCNRRISLLEPILSVIYAYRSFCHVGHQSLTNDKELVDFFTRTQEQLQSLHVEQRAETKKYNELIRTMNEIERLNPDIYNVEHELALGDAETFASVKTDSAFQKQGYLFLKNKSALLTKWDRLYFFIQTGNLMFQPRDELAGKLAIELLPGVKASTNDAEDRRHTFSVTCFKTKHQLVLQAQNDKERDDWVNVINTVANDVDQASADHFAIPNNKRESVKESKPGQKDAIAAKKDAADIDLPIQFDLLTASEDDSSNLAFEPEKMHPDVFSCPVKFLGSLEVAADRSEKIVDGAVKKILDTRASHHITRALDVNFVVNTMPPSSPHLFLVEHKDGRSAELLASFRLDDLAQWLVNRSKPESVALVIRTKMGRADGKHKFTCYLFDALDEKMAERICHQLTESTRHAFQAMASSGSMSPGQKSGQKSDQKSGDLHHVEPGQQDPKLVLVESGIAEKQVAGPVAEKQVAGPVAEKQVAGPVAGLSPEGRQDEKADESKT